MHLTGMLDDLEVPVSGNLEGDLTVQAFLDYNCPYCKAAEPELRRFVLMDKRTSLLSRDWPILSEASNYGARLALAAVYQNRYEDVHRALLGVSGRSTRTAMLDAIRRIGLDIGRLEADARTHEAAISRLLARNAEVAAAFGFRSVPSLLFGSIKVGAGFYFENFMSFAAKAREAGRAEVR